MTRCDTSQRAFTLVEFLAVLAIIAILAAVVFSGMARARASARATQCLSNMREVARAVLLFASDNKGRCPALYIGSAYGDLGPWSRQLVDAGFIPEPPHVFTCPDDGTALAVTASAATATTPYNRKNTGRSYAYTLPAMQPVSGNGNRHVPLILGTVTSPTRVFMLVEFWQGTGQDYRQIAGSLAASDIAAARHGSRMHFAYLDGHVAALPREEAAEQRHWISQ